MAARQTITSRTFILANRGVCRKVTVVLGEKLNQGVRSGIGTAFWGGGERNGRWDVRANYYMRISAIHRIDWDLNSFHDGGVWLIRASDYTTGFFAHR